MGQFDLGIVGDRLHETVGHGDGDIEVGQVALVLGVDKQFDVGVVAAQNAHLCAAPGTGGFHGFTRAVEDPHVRYGARGTRLRPFDLRALWPDRGKIVAHATAASHGLGGFRQGAVDARPAVDDFDDGIAHRLHKTVDQSGRQGGAGGRVDPAGRNEAVLLRPQKALFPLGAMLLLFVGSERLGNAATHIVNVCFRPLGVFLDKDLGGDFLPGQRENFRNFRNRGKRKLLCFLAHGAAFLISLYREALSNETQPSGDFVSPGSPPRCPNYSSIIDYDKIER